MAVVLSVSFFLVYILFNKVKACSPPADIKAVFNSETGNIEVTWKPPQLAPGVSLIKYLIYVSRNDPNYTTGLKFQLPKPVFATKYRFTLTTHCSTGYSEGALIYISNIGEALFATVGETITFNWMLTPSSDPLIDVRQKDRDSLLFILNGNDPQYVPTGVYSGRVTYNGQRENKIMSFQLTGVVKQDAGYFMSRQGTTDIGGKVLVVLDKPTKPVVSGGQSIVGKPLVLTCESKSTSKPDYYVADLQYTWWINGLIYTNSEGNPGRYVTLGKLLTVNEIQKTDKGHTFSCQASDQGQKSDKSGEVAIDPLYGPDAISLVPDTKIYNIKVGEKLGPISCTADCNPACRFEWKWNRFSDKSRRTFSSTNSLSIDRVRRADEGEYRCIATRGRTDVTPEKKTRVVTLNVLFQSVISSITYSVNGNPPQRYNDREARMSENDNVELICATEANPPPRISWEQNGNSLNNHPSNLSLSHQLKSVSCTQSGTYTCTANNGIGSTVNKNVELRVNCMPRRDNRFPAKMKYGSRINSVVNINISIIAYPKPTVDWKTNTSGTITGKQEIDMDVFRFTYLASVNIRSQNDFGHYSLEMNNNIGNLQRISFQIIAEDKPLAPMNFTYLDTFTDRINLTWISNFDGGKQQTFHVEYRAKGDNTAFNKINKTDEGFGKNITITVLNLKAATLYEFQLYSSNELGRSDTTVELEVQTKAYPSPETQTASTTGIIVGVIVAVILALIVVAVVYFIHRRRQGPKKQTHNGPKVDVVYAAVNKTDKHQDEGAIYENSPGPMNAWKEPEKPSKPPTSNKKTSEEANGRHANQDGLIYVDVDVGKDNKKKTKPVIHGDEKTEYMSIDFTKKAEPLPDEEDEIQENQGHEKV